LKVGQFAPDFEFTDQDGRRAQLSQFRGEVVLLHFWATWCPPCTEEMPDLEALSRRFQSQKLRVITIGEDSDIQEVRKFYEAHALTLPAYVDEKNRISKMYGVYKFPETFLIDANGVIRKHYVGIQSWTNPRELRFLEDVMKQPVL
jgi:cytochrome c biogenesis protein CcmG, thiol:disulfide interchange protein DsbE